MTSWIEQAKKNRLHDLHLFMSLISYETLAGKGDLLWYILDSFLTATNALANKDYEVYLELESIEGKTVRTTALGKKIEEFKERILSGQNPELVLSIDDTSKSKLPGWLRYQRPVVIFLEWNEYVETNGATLLEFGITQWFANLIGVERIQNLLINCMQKICQEIDVVTGFITHDRYWPEGITVTAHERYTRHSLYTDSSYLKNLFRGYFWGNLLSEKHIETLGGFESVVKNAPCCQVSKVGEKNVFLQLTPSILDFSDEALTKLKDYFRPILAKKVKESDPRGYNDFRFIPDKED